MFCCTNFQVKIIEFLGFFLKIGSNTFRLSLELLHNTIKHVDMQKNRLQGVDDETFQGLHLETLKLIDNKLEVFSKKSFM